MSRATRRLSSAGLVLLALAATQAHAQAPAPTPAPTPAPSPSPEPPKIDVTGLVDVYYGYNFNKVDPIARTFDVYHNTFSLSLAEVAFQKGVAPDSRVGFRADLDFGKTADLVAAYEPSSDGKEVYKHIQQAYLSLLTGQVQWDAGKFVTPMGAEVIESKDNWNYTRSILFGYAIPFYHVGVRATYNPNAKLSLAGYLVNGWNNSTEINGNKTVDFSLTWKPNAKFTWVANDMFGEETKDSSATRNLFDTTLTYTSGKLSLMGNYDYGSEGSTKWWGIAAYAKYQASAKWAAVGRYEYADDTKGGFMTFGTKIQEVTITSDHLIAGGLIMRLEYRTDFAADAIFPKDDGSKQKSQTTLTVGLVYGFAGKI